MSERSEHEDVAPVRVVLYGFTVREYDECLSYTVRADGYLELRLADGQMVVFGESDWIDVQMLRRADD